MLLTWVLLLPGLLTWFPVLGGGVSSGFQFPISRVPRSLSSQGLTLTGGTTLTSCQDFAYLVQVNIGGQNFPVILDTGSADLWVVSNCTLTDCKGVSQYDTTSSTSLNLSNAKFKLSYLLGSASGAVGFDTTTLGPYAILSQVFGLANNTDGLGLSGTGNSGVLGLAFSAVATIPLTLGATFLENLFWNLEEADRYFAFKLGRDGIPLSNVQSTSSSFTIGQLDPTIVNSSTGFAYTPASRAGSNEFNFWKMPLKALSVNSTYFALSPSLIRGAKTPIAVLDTGTTLILGPTPDVEAFWATVGKGGTARKNVHSGSWEVRCDRAVAVSFLLGAEGNETEYFVDPRDINWEEGEDSEGWCMGGIQANDAVNSGDWLLGDVFLRNVYVSLHIATSTQPPVIGLLGLTDPSESMSEFLRERGPDFGPLASIQSRIVGQLLKVPSTAVISVSSATGFMGGLIMTILFRVRRTRMLVGDPANKAISAQ